MTTALSLVGALLVDLAVVVMLARTAGLTRALVRTAAAVRKAIDAWILLGGWPGRLVTRPA